MYIHFMKNMNGMKGMNPRFPLINPIVTVNYDIPLNKENKTKQTICKISIWLRVGTLTGTITLGQGGPRSNGNKQIIPSSIAPETVLYIRCSLISYPGHPFSCRGL